MKGNHENQTFNLGSGHRDYSRALRPRAELSREAGAHHRAAGARRQRRHRRALARPAADRQHGPADHRREPARREQPGRHAARRQSGARRLYAARHREHFCDGAVDRDQSRLRSAEGLCRHHADLPGAAGAGGESRAAGEIGQGTDCAGEGAAGATHVRDVGPGRHRAHGDRTLQPPGRRENAARAVQGQCAGDHRRHRRAGHADVRPGEHVGALHQGRQAAPARGLQPHALAAVSRSADDQTRRARRASKTSPSTGWWRRRARRAKYSCA